MGNRLVPFYSDFVSSKFCVTEAEILVSTVIIRNSSKISSARLATPYTFHYHTVLWP